MFHSHSAPEKSNESNGLRAPARGGEASGRPSQLLEAAATFAAFVR
jgi:hypothetical protein